MNLQYKKVVVLGRWFCENQKIGHWHVWPTVNVIIFGYALCNN